MKKIEVYLTGIVIIVTVVLYFFKFKNITTDYENENFTYEVPIILSIKDNNTLKSNYIANPIVWGLKAKKKNSIKSDKAKKAHKDGFVYKDVGGIPSLCKISNEKYRWEFYGTVYKQKTIMAIFYNPEIKKDNVKLLKQDSILDKNLIVKKVEDNYVEIEYIGKKEKNETFKLSIFNQSNLKE